MTSVMARPARPLSLAWIGVFLAGALIGALGLRLVDTPAVAQTESSLAQSARNEANVPTNFKISSFNVLGDGHTAKGGNRKGWASGATRMGWTVDLMRKHSIDVMGFQELQPPQFKVFKQQAGAEYQVWPGNVDGRGFLRNSIAWKRDQWALESSSWLKVPYFGGSLLRMPVVLLSHLETGQRAYFMNFHNPANARGNAEKWRDQGRAMQSDLVNQLREESGLPVFWTGDFNEKEEAFCDVTRRTGMVSASGGYSTDTTCTPATPLYVDWIFGTVETEFTGYLADRSRKARRSSDHPLLVAQASLPPTPWCPAPA